MPLCSDVSQTSWEEAGTDESLLRMVHISPYWGML